MESKGVSARKRVEATHLENRARLSSLEASYRSEVALFKNAESTESASDRIRATQQRMRETLRKFAAPVPPSMEFFPPFPERGIYIPGTGLVDIIRPPRYRVVRRVSCRLDVNLSPVSETYIEFPAVGSSQADPLPGKAASGVANAGGADQHSTVSFGYESTFHVPAAAGQVHLTIHSRVNASVNWLEASLFGSGDSALAKASSFIIVSSVTGSATSAEASLAALEGAPAVNAQTAIHSGAEHVVELSVPQDSDITVQEWVRIETLMVPAAGGSAHLDGSFTWDPLSVRASEGCRVITTNLGVIPGEARLID